MSGVRVVLAACGLIAVMTGSAGAQAPHSGSFALTPAASALVGSGRLGLSANAPLPSEAARDEARRSMAAGIRHRGPGVALMIVGGAGIVTGLLIDEPVVSVVGALAGLYGLYLYIR
ncbi:MAG TPA: hypothetical protein VFU23_12000 [Gemmatimonadales bacterium]|nr:hypothetical protein [Gemmatimonadales bacterium]